MQKNECILDMYWRKISGTEFELSIRSEDKGFKDDFWLFGISDQMDGSETL